MNKIRRKLLLYLSTIFFILITPITIAYALGYTFDWVSKKPVLTGNLYVYSIPEKATVSVNNKPREAKTPLFVRRLKPNYYHIEVGKEGYQTWQKDIEIKSRLITEFKDVLLIPITPKIEILDNNLPINFSLVNYLNDNTDKPNNLYYFKNDILYKTDSTGLKNQQISLNPLPENNDYKIFAPKENKIAVLNNFDLYILDSDTRNFDFIANKVNFLEFSGDKEKILYTTNNEIWVYYFFNKEKELITRSSQNIEHAFWHTQTDKHIIFVVDSLIKIIELDNRNKRNTFNIFESPVEQITYNQEDNAICWTTENKLLSISMDK
ncbi:MAG: PEGA domain-containing protein [bacterium]